MSASNLATKQNPRLKEQRFSVSLARTDDDIKRCLKLRHEIFAVEFGANINTIEQGLDKDRFDDYCQHLMVVDNRTNQLISTTRLLISDDTKYTNGFYSETEFDLSDILIEGRRYMEVGRTCVHPDYRNGSALAMLWQGIGSLVSMNKIDYLIGCASISLSGGFHYVESIMHHLRDKHFSSEDLRVTPRIPLQIQDIHHADDVILPTLLKGYLRQGAVICGEAYWDAAFGVADVFVLLDSDNISKRYVKHFMNRS